MTNEDRIAFANIAIEAYRAATNSDDDSILTDLLTDLMHWGNADFEAALSMARMHHETECQEDEEAEG